MKVHNNACHASPVSLSHTLSPVVFTRGILCRGMWSGLRFHDCSNGIRSWGYLITQRNIFLGHVMPLQLTKQRGGIREAKLISLTHWAYIIHHTIIWNILQNCITAHMQPCLFRPWSTVQFQPKDMNTGKWQQHSLPCPPSVPPLCF